MFGHELEFHPWLREKMLIAFFSISRRLSQDFDFSL
jgi:hypothetical protein